MASKDKGGNKASKKKATVATACGCKAFIVKVE